MLLTNTSSSVVLVYSQHGNVASYQTLLIDVQLTDDSTNAAATIQSLTINN